MGDFINYFHFDEEYKSFEDYGQANGTTIWWARDLMEMLGYESFASFENAINKAIQACTTLRIPVLGNFTQAQREIDGRSVMDYKLSRFACYLTAMNGDTKKPQIAKAQAYFAAMAETVREHLQSSENVERLIIRGDVSERERSLAGVAKMAGVQHYGIFQNEGYRGMYNMTLRNLKDFKGVDQSCCLLDFMGKEELAANLFRITQTEAKIKTDRVRGQSSLDIAAFQVGQKVRRTMQEISGTNPESLPVTEDIAHVKRDLKKAQKELAKGKRISGIEWISPKGAQRKRVAAPLNQRVRERVAATISSPRKVQRQIDGVLDMADFKPNDLRCRIDPAIGASVVCTFDERDATQVQLLMRQPVRVTGEAIIAPYSDRVETLNIYKIERLPSLSLGEGNFFAESSISELAASQKVKPLKDTSTFASGFPPDEDIDEFLEEIYSARK